MAQGRVQDVFSVRAQFEVDGTAVRPDGHFADLAGVLQDPGVVLLDDGPGVLRRGIEQLVVDTGLGHTFRAQSAGDLRDHGLGTAQEEFIGGGDVNKVLVLQLRPLAVVDASVQDLRVLFLPAQYVDPVETIQVAVLEKAQPLLEHDGGRTAVAVDQGHAAPGFGGQDGLNNGDDGGDAAAGGDAHVVFPVVRVQFRGKRPTGGHDFHDFPGPELVIGIIGKHTAGDPFYRHFQTRVADAGTDGVGAAYFLTVQGRAQGQILALPETEDVGELLGDFETHA